MFHSLDFKSVAPFNSDASCKVLQCYNNIIETTIQSERSELKARTFAPSSFRCKRLNWFRLRGVEPDIMERVDKSLNFTAKMGEACHTMIQSALSRTDLWMDVEYYINSMKQFLTFPDQYSVTKYGYEYRIKIDNPPVQFACDGMLVIGDVPYLLEIKSCDRATWESLTGPKSYHIDQVQCYCTLLALSNVIFIYIDRTFGDIKCYETVVTESQRQTVLDTFDIVIKHVEQNIAPEGLPANDRNCTGNMCPYYKKCREWGR